MPNKPGRPKKKNPGGRPSVITEPILLKLEQAFAVGCTDVEACFESGISPATLYLYQKKHPKFIERKEALKRIPITTARKTIVKALQEDPNHAFKYLERKQRDEFGPVQKIEGEIRTEHELSPALADMFNKIYKKET